MDKVTLGFLFLLAVIFLSSLLLNESFVDASGTRVDASGSRITLSLSDLFSLIGGGNTTTSSTTSSTRSTTQAVQPIQVGQGGIPESSFDQQFYSNLKGTILSDVRQTVRDTLQSSSAGQGGAARNAGPVLTDSCIDSVAAQQGADFMRYIPGKNPADYIRKDSVPCYGCSIPS